jgi:dTDP-4-amino-4,6-dideoxygalactose transaminase
MYFVHPQIKFNDLKNVAFSLFGAPHLDGLKKELSFYFPRKKIFFTDMGRTAFRLIIEKLNLQNSQILFPAFICDIFYPILKEFNIQPVFLDIDLKTFHPKIEEIKKKISPQTRAILICHTFGLPVDIKEIVFQLRRSDIEPPLIIEDYAQAFGAQKNGKFVGNFGDVSIFSLYKQLPSLRGGMLVCPENWQLDLPKTSFNFRDFISLLNCFPFFAFLFKKFGSKIAPKMIRGEKFSQPSQINRVSLNLFSYFLKNFEKDLKNRIEVALFFQKELKNFGFEVQEEKDNVFCYLSALIPKKLKNKRDRLVKELRRQRIFCTRIWHTPIILNKVAQKEYKINLDEFPNTVEAAKRIINFPLQNYYTKEDIKRIIDGLKNSLYTIDR